MKLISDLTYKVAAFSEIPNFKSDECVDWAIEMLELGFESESLLILCGLSKPTNYFETIEYLKEAFEELNLTFKTGEDGIISYSNYLIKDIASNKNVKANLKLIQQLCIDKDYEKVIYDFYLLHWAWGDYDYGNEFQEYWTEATPETIEQIVIDRAKKWIEENENNYAQPPYLL